MGQSSSSPKRSTSPKKLAEHKIKPKDEDVVKVVTASGKKVYTTKGFNPDKLRRRIWKFSEVIAEEVCHRIAEGNTIIDICQEEGFPPVRTVYHWSRMYPAFRKALHAAKEDQGHYHADRIHQLTEDITNKRDAHIAKVKIMGHKWLAEKKNSSSYATKSVVEGNPDKPVKIMIDTGIRREVIDVQSTDRESIGTGMGQEEESIGCEIQSKWDDSQREKADQALEESEV